MKQFFLFCFLAIPFLALAQTNTVPAPPGTPAPGSGFNLLLTLIPLVVPLVVATVKTAIGKLPTWSLPVLATALGAAFNWILGMAGQPNTTLLNGAILGAAGTGIREIYDQIKGTITTQAPPPVNPT